MSTLIQYFKKSSIGLQFSFKMKFKYKFQCNINLTRTLTSTGTGATCKNHIYSPKNVVFFGTDGFALTSLKSLLIRKQEGLIEKLHIVTTANKPWPAVPKFCIESKISFQEWPLESPIENFDLGIVVSFGHLIPVSIIESFPLGMINVHGSLLPRWRGSSPIIHAVLNRETETGITIMKISPHKFDVGEILYQESMKITKDMKSLELTHKMALLGAKCLSHSLDNIETLLLNSTPQPSIGHTNAPKIKSLHSEILWNQMTSELIRSMFLAFDDYHPLWTSWHGKKLTLKELHRSQSENKPRNEDQSKLDIYKQIKGLRTIPKISEETIVKQIEGEGNCSFTFPGQVLYMRGEGVIRIKCLDGFVEFKKISVKGKKTMSASEFYNGFLSKVGLKQRYFH